MRHCQELIEPEVVREAVVVLLIRVINRFIMVTTVIVAKCGQNQSIREMLLEFCKGSCKISFDDLVVKTVRIIPLSSRRNFVRN